MTKLSARVEAVVVVEVEGVRVFGDGPAVDGDLAVVLAAVLQRQLEGAHGARGEGREADPPLDLRIIGATVVAPRAGETIAQLAAAVRLGWTPSQYARTVHPYPTYADGPWHAALLDVYDRHVTPGSATRGSGKEGAQPPSTAPRARMPRDNYPDPGSGQRALTPRVCDHVRRPGRCATETRRTRAAAPPPERRAAPAGPVPP